MRGVGEEDQARPATMTSKAFLEEAQHVLAFALPPVLWSYTPREFNRCADYLAGVARDHVKEHFAQSSPTLFGLLPFLFPLPPSLLFLFFL